MFTVKDVKRIIENLPANYNLGHSNHEIWRHCIPCDEHWDAKKELSGVCCPKCGTLGDIG